MWMGSLGWILALLCIIKIAGGQMLDNNRHQLVKTRTNVHIAVVFSFILTD